MTDLAFVRCSAQTSMGIRCGQHHGHSGAHRFDEAACRLVPRPDCPYREIEDRMAPGDLIESPHPYPAVADLWLYRCPLCGKVWTMRVPDVHQIVSRDPLTVTPSWLCPSGCHYYIRNGRIENA